MQIVRMTAEQKAEAAAAHQQGAATLLRLLPNQPLPWHYESSAAGKAKQWQRGSGWRAALL